MIRGEIKKVSDELGLVFGYAVVCRAGGEDHYDLDGEHIPEAAMLKASTKFMMHSRVGGDMHTEEVAGAIVHSWPMTGEVASAFDIDTHGVTGWMIAFKPDSPDLLAKFRSGEYRGFSIGGRRRLSQDTLTGDYIHFTDSEV